MPNSVIFLSSLPKLFVFFVEVRGVHTRRIISSYNADPDPDSRIKIKIYSATKIHCVFKRLG